MIHNLKYLNSTTVSCKDIGIRKAEFVAETQFFFLNSLILIKLRFKVNHCQSQLPLNNWNVSWFTSTVHLKVLIFFRNRYLSMVEFYHLDIIGVILIASTIRKIFHYFILFIIFYFLLFFTFHYFLLFIIFHFS